MDGNKSVVGIIVAILILVGVGVGIYALTSNDEDSDTNTSQTTQEEANEVAENEAMTEESQDIVALAVATPDLSTLVTAVTTADLAETLSGEGPYTVLAPDNDAFAAALAELNITADELLAREDLADILTYHVIAGDVMSSDLTNGQVVTTVNGETLTVEVSNAGVYFVDANGRKALVKTADIEASNGVVHIIDTVLLP